MPGTGDVGLLLRLKADSSQAKTELTQFRQTVKTQAGQIAQEFGRAFPSGGILGNLTNEVSRFAGIAKTQFAEAGASGAGMGAALSGAGVVAAAGIGSIIAISAGAGAAMFYLSKSAADLGDKYWDMSQKVNISAHTLSALDVAANQSGSSIANLEAAFGIFDRNLETAHDSTTEQSRVFKVLGVDINDNEKALTQLFTILAKIPPGAEQTALAMQVFGRSGKDVLGVIKQANGDLPGLIKHLDDIGATLSQKDIEAANDFNDAWAQLTHQFDVSKAKIGVELFPILEKLFGKMTTWIADNKGELKAWGKAFADAADVAVKSASAVYQAYSWIKKSLPDRTGTGFFAKEGGPENPLNFLNLDYQGSYYHQFLDWMSNLGGTDTSQWKQGLGKATTEVQNSSQIAATAAASKKAAEDEAAAAKKQADEAAAMSKRIQDALKEQAKAKKENVESEEEILTRELEVIRAGDEAIQVEFQKHSDAERDAYEDQTISLKDYVKIQGILEGQRLSQLNALYSAERTAILDSGIAEDAKLAKLADVRKKILKAQADHDRAIVEQQRNQSREVLANEQAEREALARMRAEGDQFAITQIQRNADKQAITYQEAAKRINKIQQDALEAKGLSLDGDLLRAGNNEAARQQALDAIASWVGEYIRFLVLAGQAEDDAKKKDAEYWAQISENTRKRNVEIQEEEIANEIFVKEHFGRIVTSLKDYLTNHRQYINDLRDLYLQEEDVRHQDVLDQLSFNEAQEKAADTSGARLLEIESYYNKKREEENQRHNNTTRDIGETAAAQDRGAISGANITPRDAAGNIIPWDQVSKGQSAIAGLSAATAELGKIGLEAFGTLAQGIGNLVSNYVLLGHTGPAALKKLLAASLAQVAAEATVRGIFWTAQGIVDLFFDPPRAAADFAGAALFFSIAGASAIAGRSLAGNLFNGEGANASRGATASSASGANASGGSQSQTQTITQGRNQAPEPIILHVHAHTDGGVIIDKIVADVQNNGRMRDVIIRTAA